MKVFKEGNKHVILDNPRACVNNFLGNHDIFLWPALLNPLVTSYFSMKTAKFFVFLFGMVGNIWLIKKLIQVWKKKKAVASGCREILINSSSIASVKLVW